MAYRTATFETLVPWIARLPVGQHFDTDLADGGLEMQAATQDDVAALLLCFPGVIWQKEWVESVGWWQYTGKTMDGIRLQIYAVRQAPRTCTAIMEEREVEERVATGYETRKVRKQVIVGWDCGQPDKEEV